jgi:hypothetical protein
MHRESQQAPIWLTRRSLVVAQVYPEQDEGMLRPGNNQSNLSPIFEVQV